MKHVLRYNAILCCYNLCIISSMLSYEVSMFYDICRILDLLQSINILSNPLVKMITPSAAYLRAIRRYYSLLTKVLSFILTLYADYILSTSHRFYVSGSFKVDKAGSNTCIVEWFNCYWISVSVLD